VEAQASPAAAQGTEDIRFGDDVAALDPAVIGRAVQILRDAAALQLERPRQPHVSRSAFGISAPGRLKRRRNELLEVLMCLATMFLFTPEPRR
jgi:hypothetical protein